MKYSIRTAAIGLAMLMALSQMACARGETETVEDTAAQTEAVSAETEETRLKPDIPETADYNGDEIRFLHWQHPEWIGSIRDCRDLDAEALTGEAINDAVFNRNTYVEENYNVEIVLENRSIGTFNKDVHTAVQSGDNTYDVVYPILLYMNELCIGGDLANLMHVPHIDFTKPWWDQNAVQSMSIGGYLPAVASSINVNDKDATTAIAFNKQLATDNNLPDLYTTVEEGKWTMDLFMEYADACNVDVNGDGTMTVDDRYGFLGGNDVMYAFYYGSGQLMVTKDTDDMFQFTYGTERDINVTQKIYDLMQENWFFNHHQYKDTSDEFYRILFETGHGLFYWMRLDDVTAMRESDADFGILPTPKYDEAQEKYWSVLSPYTTGILSIPVSTAGDQLEEVGLILEAMAAYSHYTLIPAYVDESLKTKYSRDEQSAGMMDIIIENRLIDPMMVYNFGKFRDEFIQFGNKANLSIASTIQQKKKSVDQDVAKKSESIRAFAER